MVVPEPLCADAVSLSPLRRTRYSKAVHLKSAMETFVNIHLKDPELATQLMMDAEDPMTGHLVPERILAHVTPLESGKYRDPALAQKYVKKKVGSTPFASL